MKLVLLLTTTLLASASSVAAAQDLEERPHGREVLPDTRPQQTWTPWWTYLGNVAVWNAKKGVVPQAVLLDVAAGTWKTAKLPKALAGQVRSDGNVPETFARHGAGDMVWWIGDEGSYGLNVKTLQWTTVDTPAAWPGTHGNCQTLDGLWRCWKSDAEGYDPTELVFFDLRRGRWLDLAEAGADAAHDLGPRRLARWHWVGEQLFVWGGTTAPGKNFQESGAVFDTEKQEWRAIPSEGAPRGVVSYSAVMGDEIWMTTASRNGRDGAVFDLENGTWRPLPASIQETSAVYSFDGRFLVWDHTNHENFVYDPATGEQFVAKQPMPGAKASIGGGAYQATLMLVRTQRHYVLDFNAKAWTAVENPGPPHRPARYRAAVRTACYDVVPAESCSGQPHCSELPEHWSSPTLVAHRKARCALDPWRPGGEVSGRPR